MAIRGKMQGHSYEGMANGTAVQTSKNTKSALSKPKKSSRALPQASAGSRTLPVTLQDPSMSNLDQTSKYYIDYCKGSHAKL